MNDLGLLYNNGQGVAQDDTKAREWDEKAKLRRPARVGE
jgi:TPR repeat protein